MDLFKTMGNRKGVLFAGEIILLAILQPATIASADNVTLEWGASTSSNIAGYYLYYGTVSGLYTNKSGPYKECGTILSGLQPNQMYYFVATAVDSAGTESPNSNEATYKAPSTPPVVIAMPDSFVRLAGQTMAIANATLLANDQDKKGYPLTVKSVQAKSDQGVPIHLTGTTTTYLPSSSMTNADSFTYVAGDAFGNSATGQVHIAVQPSGPKAAPDLNLVKDTLLHIHMGGATPGATYVVQTKVKLTDPTWQDLDVVTADSAGNGVAHEYISNTAESGFYRTVAP